MTKSGSHGKFFQLVEQIEFKSIVRCLLNVASLVVSTLSWHRGKDAKDDVAFRKKMTQKSQQTFDYPIG